MFQVLMPSGSTFPVVPVSSTPTSGIGVGYPMPHPGDGSIDFTKTEMVTPKTSLNMSMSAFLSRYLNIFSLHLNKDLV